MPWTENSSVFLFWGCFSKRERNVLACPKVFVFERKLFGFRFFGEI